MANDPADTCAPGGPRPPGRPRDPAVHVAILDAAEALLAEAGYARMSVEAVAARAGTSKATIYRWWPSKEALVVEALERRRVAIDVPRTDDPRADLVALLRAMVATLPPRSHSPIARLVGATADSDELAALLRTRIVGPRRARVGELVTAAVDAGALDPAVDL
jgi:AcrR family transcriptional regulator